MRTQLGSELIRYEIARLEEMAGTVKWNWKVDKYAENCKKMVLGVE